MTITLKAFRERAEETVVGRIGFQLSMWKFSKPSYGEWVTLIEDSIQHVMTETARERHHLSKLGEDPITSTVVITLRSLGLQATSAVINGNCDVVIHHDDYLWLAEAKLAESISHVWGGYLQLTRRYATGLPNQNAGGMLLYCTHSNANEFLAAWRKALSIDIAKANARDWHLPLTFRSSDVCQSSGLNLEILHFAFPLFHDPQEDKVPISKAASTAAREVKKEMQKAN